MLITPTAANGRKNVRNLIKPHISLIFLLTTFIRIAKIKNNINVDSIQNLSIVT